MARIHAGLLQSGVAIPLDDSVLLTKRIVAIVKLIARYDVIVAEVPDIDCTTSIVRFEQVPGDSVVARMDDINRMEMAGAEAPLLPGSALLLRGCWVVDRIDELVVRYDIGVRVLKTDSPNRRTDAEAFPQVLEQAVLNDIVGVDTDIPEITELDGYCIVLNDEVVEDEIRARHIGLIVVGKEEIDESFTVEHGSVVGILCGKGYYEVIVGEIPIDSLPSISAGADHYMDVSRFDQKLIGGELEHAF